MRYSVWFAVKNQQNKKNTIEKAPIIEREGCVCGGGGGAGERESNANEIGAIGNITAI